MEFDPNLLFISSSNTIRALNTTPQGIRTLVYNHHLRTVMVGGRAMFYREDVDNYAKKIGLPMTERPTPSPDVPRPMNWSYGMPGTNNVETSKETNQEHI